MGTNHGDPLEDSTTLIAQRCDTTTYLPGEPGFRRIFERGSVWISSRIANHSTGFFNDSQFLIRNVHNRKQQLSSLHDRHAQSRAVNTDYMLSDFFFYECLYCDILQPGRSIPPFWNSMLILAQFTSKNEMACSWKAMVSGTLRCCNSGEHDPNRK